LKYLVGLLFLITSSVFGEEVSLEGNIRFEVETNIPGMSFEGSNKKLINFKAVRKKSGEYQSLNLSLPSDLFETGLDLRDDHMRKQIFMDRPIKIELEKLCSMDKPCSSTGFITIGDKKNEVIVVFKKFGKNSYVGQSEISLKKIGIKAPSMAGVSVEDKVVVHLDFKDKK